jgi:hypothetical protein
MKFGPACKAALSYLYSLLSRPLNGVTVVNTDGQLTRLTILARSDIFRPSIGYGEDRERTILLRHLTEQNSLRIHKGGHEIRSIDDWFEYAPPKMGARHWKDGRSAKELARSWVRKGYAFPPEEIRELLEAAFNGEITFHEAKPECVIELDDFPGENRNCDLVLLLGIGQRMVVNVEAKADEPFGDDTIGDYYDRTSDSRSNVPARIRQLSSALFGRVPDAAIRRLRYQLLHAAAATLIEAAVNKAEFGLFLVHEFRSPRLKQKKLTRNSTDWENFVHVFPELAGAQVEKNQILGPVSVPGGGACRAPSRSIWGNWSLSLNRLTANRIVSGHTNRNAATIPYTRGTGS